MSDDLVHFAEKPALTSIFDFTKLAVRANGGVKREALVKLLIDDDV